MAQRSSRRGSTRIKLPSGRVLAVTSCQVLRPPQPSNIGRNHFLRPCFSSARLATLVQKARCASLAKLTVLQCADYGLDGTCLVRPALHRFRRVHEPHHPALCERPGRRVRLRRPNHRERQVSSRGLQLQPPWVVPTAAVSLDGAGAAEPPRKSWWRGRRPSGQLCDLHRTETVWLVCD